MSVYQIVTYRNPVTGIISADPVGIRHWPKTKNYVLFAVDARRESEAVEKAIELRRQEERKRGHDG